jgi:hypothetical protein
VTQVVIGTNVSTLADWATRVDPEGKIPVIVELLAQKNEVIPDMHWQEGNLPTGHRIIQRTGLPTVMARSLNQGIPPSKSTTTQVDEATASLEGFLEIDKDVAELNGEEAAFRMSEADAFIEGMNQGFAALQPLDRLLRPKHPQRRRVGLGQHEHLPRRVGTEQRLRHLPEGLASRPSAP